MYRLPEVRVVVQCDAVCSDTLEIVRLDMDKDTSYYIQFRIDSFYAGQSIWGIVKERIKLAWLALRKGNYIHQEIVTSKEDLNNLYLELGKLLMVSQ